MVLAGSSILTLGVFAQNTDSTSKTVPRTVLVELFVQEGCLTCPTAEFCLERLAYHYETTGIHINNIYVVNANGSEKSIFCYGLSPAWSPDGSKIAFVELSNTLCIVNVDGSEKREIAREFRIDNFVWSPDGSKIIIKYGKALGDHLTCVANADGSGKHKVGEGFHFERAEDNDFTWSPDGSKIAIIDWHSLYIANVDGSDITKVDSEHYVLDDVDSPSWAPAIKLSTGIADTIE